MTKDQQTLQSFGAIVNDGSHVPEATWCGLFEQCLDLGCVVTKGDDPLLAARLPAELRSAKTSVLCFPVKMLRGMKNWGAAF